MSNKSHDQIYDEFYDLVNMTPNEFEKWLDTDNIRNVSPESVYCEVLRNNAQSYVQSYLYQK